MHQVIQNILDKAISRLLVRRISFAIWKGGLIAAVVGVSFLILLKVGEGPRDVSKWSLAIWVLGIGSGLLLGCRKTLHPYEAAKFVDNAAGLQDRLSSAYGLIQSGKSGGMVDLAVQDAVAAAKTIRLSAVMPSPAWGRLLLSTIAFPLLLLAVQRQLFPPPIIQKAETFSETELGAALSALDMAIDDPQAFQKLQEELKKLGVGETTEKSELLARLNRTIAELKEQAETDDGVLNTLAQMEKLKSKLGLAELQMRADAELRQVENLVTDEGVQAETIMVDRLVDPTNARKIAKGLKEVAGEQLAASDGSAQGVDAEGSETTTPEGQTTDGSPKKRTDETKESKKEELLAVQAISDHAIRKRILEVARTADRTSKDYNVVYKNYRRAFLAELFRTDLGSGRREYLERYFHTIRPE
ncbi:MAG: hypothetical protein O3B01_24545 [Planctomycetota bacterium]|nr:hypothetical protein [Planctomycetota bacterium]